MAELAACISAAINADMVIVMTIFMMMMKMMTMFMMITMMKVVMMMGVSNSGDGELMMNIASCIFADVNMVACPCQLFFSYCKNMKHVYD